MQKKNPSNIKRIFVFGSKGMLGWMVCSYLRDIYGDKIIPIDRAAFEVLEDDLFEWAQNKGLSSMDLIINCTGITNRYLHLAEAIFYRVNRDFPLEIGKLAGKYHCKAVHISTDCVFSGRRGDYDEKSIPDPADVYGKSKHVGQVESLIVLRSSFVGIETKHFNELFSWLVQQEGKTIMGYSNHYWNGMTTLQFAKGIAHFIECGFPNAGLYHIHSPEVITKHNLIRLFTEIFEMDIKIVPFKTNPPVYRSLRSIHPISASLNLPAIRQQLEELKDYCLQKNIPWKSV